jgi:hypothetical protein
MSIHIMEIIMSTTLNNFHIMITTLNNFFDLFFNIRSSIFYIVYFYLVSTHVIYLKLLPPSIVI